MENSLATTLKKLRQDKGFTIISLASKAGIGKGTVGDIETGKSHSTVKTLEKIAFALNLNESERELLFSCLVPSDIANKFLYSKLDSRGKSQFNDLLEDSKTIFNNVEISDTDKEKILLAIQNAFYDAKQKRKKKKII